MPAQKRETGKNYIGLLREDAEESRAAEVLRTADLRMKAYVLGLMAAVFNRRNEVR